MRQLLRRLNHIFDRRTKVKLLLATVASIVIALLDTVAIALVLPLVNLATGHESDSDLLEAVRRVTGEIDSRTLIVVLTVAVVSLFILKDIGAVWHSWWLGGFKAFNRVELSARLLRHYLTAPYTQVANRNASELIRTMSDAVVQVFGTTVYALMHLMASLISISSIVVALLISAPIPTLALMAYFGIAATIYLRVVKPRARAAGEAAASASRHAWRTALAALGGLKETHLRGSADHFVNNYRTASMEGASAARTAEFIGMLPRYLLEVMFIAAVGVILLTGVSTDPAGGVGGSVGVLALFVAAGFRVLPSVTGLLEHINSLRFGSRFLDLVYREVEEERRLQQVTPAWQGGGLLPFRDRMTVHEVTFTYPGASRPALRDVSFEVRRGSVVALVGGSGAGKTTLVDVILGLHLPGSGWIEVDGIDIRSDLRGWQDRLAYVPQDVYLFESTLAENIAFDEDPEHIDYARVAAAVRSAQLTDLVDSLPDGIRTVIGERGATLSGGQRQRVGIARALYRQPSVLVLDEATSALDNETEHLLSQAIYGLRGELTVLIVAHRLSTVQHADQIVFLEGGSVKAVGSFEELQHKDRSFARLVELGTLGSPR